MRWMSRAGAGDLLFRCLWLVVQNSLNTTTSSSAPTRLAQGARGVSATSMQSASYVSFQSLPQPRPSSHVALGGASLTFTEPAVREALAWRNAGFKVPRGVLSRASHEEEVEKARQEEAAKKLEDERNKRGPSLEAWMPDEACRICYACEKPFSFTNRRHHCRICGLVFCGTCSNNWVPGHAHGYGNAPIRACNECAAISATKPQPQPEDDDALVRFDVEQEPADELQRPLPAPTPRAKKVSLASAKPCVGVDWLVGWLVGWPAGWLAL
jgi:hypothetical protein